MFFYFLVLIHNRDYLVLINNKHLILSVPTLHVTIHTCNNPLIMNTVYLIN